MNPNQRQNSQQRLSSNLSNFFNMNNSKKLLIPVALIATACALSLVFFTFVNPSYDQEAALKMKPIFFGSTRVSDEPVNSITLVAPTTSAVYFNILPQKMQFQFDDLLSNDNTPLDVNMYMIIQVKKGQTPDLLRNYGENWFENFIEPYFRNKVREYVSSCSTKDKVTNQKASGRCWMFAALNTFRHKLISQYKLENFELRDEFVTESVESRKHPASTRSFLVSNLILCQIK